MAAVSGVSWKFDEWYTSMPRTTQGLVRGTNRERDWIDTPYDSPVRNEDTLGQRRSVMGTIRTCCVDFFTQLGQQNLPVAKIDFFPANRASVWNETWV